MHEFLHLIPWLGHRQPRLAGLLLWALLLALPFLVLPLGPSWVRILDFALLYVLLALGLNLVVGFAGLLDLGYIAFYAVGAYSWAFLASPHFDIHWPFWLVLPVGALLAALAGLILGAPTLRLRGDYLAIVTLGFGEIIRIFLNNLTQPINITNGPQGIAGLDPLVVFGWDLSMPLEIGQLDPLVIHPLVLAYYLFFAFVALSVVIIARLRASSIGRAWAAVRDDELAAKAIGLNTRNFKLLAFALGATFGGVAGGLFGAFQGFVSPESFSLMESIAILTMVVFGGMGNLAGVALGALVLTLLPELLRHFAIPLQESLFGQVFLDPEVLRMLLLSLAMIIMMLLRPAGLLPARGRYVAPERLPAALRGGRS